MFKQLKKEDEEFQMLLEVAEEYSKQKSGDTSRKKSGNATEIVIRNHLLKREFNVTLNPNVKIQGSKRKNDILLLKPNVDSNKLTYAPNEVDTVLEIKNNAVGGPEDIPNKKVKDIFDELERDTEVNRFAVVVLSETLLPPRKPYKWRYTEEGIGKKNCRVFTLVARKKYPKGGLYKKDAIMEMLEKEEMRRTEDWDQLLKYLQEK